MYFGVRLVPAFSFAASDSLTFGSIVLARRYVFGFVAFPSLSWLFQDLISARSHSVRLTAFQIGGHSPNTSFVKLHPARPASAASRTKLQYLVCSTYP